jgi:hypothetical protein
VPRDIGVAEARRFAAIMAVTAKKEATRARWRRVADEMTAGEIVAAYGDATSLTQVNNAMRRLPV